MHSSPEYSAAKPILGLSSCLCGNRVRYDGGHKLQAWLVADVLPWIEAVPVCPESGAGLGVPRPPVRLVAIRGGEVRMVGADNPDLDVTAAVNRYIVDLIAGLGQVDGFIVKARSPSCALRDAPLEPAMGPPTSRSGLFTAALRRHFAALPIEDEEALANAGQRRAFFDRVVVLQRGRLALTERTVKAVAAFGRTIESALAVRESTAETAVVLAQVKTVGENPERSVLEPLLKDCLALVAKPRSLGRLETYLKRDSNWQHLPVGERALRFGL